MNKKSLPIFLSFFIMGFGDVVGTLVGFARETFNLSPSLAGLLPFIGFVAFGILSVPSGVLQAKKGKKFVLLLGLMIVLCGLLIPIISLARYSFLVFAILLIGSGMAVLQVAGNPIMRDVSEPGLYSRNLTFAQFIKSIGSLSGPLLTALVLVSWTGLFPVYGLIVLVALITVAFVRIPENEGNIGSGRASISSSFKLLNNKYVFIMVLAIFLYVGAEVGLNSWIASYLNQAHGFDIKKMATLGIGFFFFALMIGRLLGSLILNWLSAKTFFIITSLISCLGICALFLGDKIIALAAIFVIGLGFANIFPLVFSILIDHMPDKSNELSGLMVMAIVGGAVMPLIMGFIAELSVKASFLVPLVSLIYITIAAFFTRKKI